jgi:hypothetical protein
MSPFTLLRLATATAIACAIAAITTTAAALGAPPERVLEVVGPGPIGADVARDGERVLFATGDSGDDSSSVLTDTAYFLARRTSSGWNYKSALPDRSLMPEEKVYVRQSSPNLDALTVVGYNGLGRPAPVRVYRYVPDTGELTVGWKIPTRLGVYASELVASDDQKRAVTRLLDEGFPAAPDAMYDLLTSEPQMLDRMPDESLSECGTYIFALTGNDLAERWISTDGRRVFYTSRGNGDCGGGPIKLFMREGDGVFGSTTLISSPPVVGPDLGADFVRATPDGSQVFYTTNSRLDPADDDDGRDVYRYAVGSGNRCVSCAGNGTANVSGHVLASESGDRVYFTSIEALTPGAEVGKTSLYVWRADAPEQLDFVAPADEMVTTGFDTGAFATSDGLVIIFKSSRPELDALTGGSNDGFSHFYRYDDRTKALECVSCPPGQATTSVPDNWGYTGLYSVEHRSVLTEDGRSFFFAYGDPLVPEDVNGSNDIYEWRDGEVALISSGTRTGSTLIYSATPDGRDVLFQQPDKDGFLKLFDARVGGGFPTVPRGVCGGDQCQGQPAGAPRLAGPGAAGSAGSGDVSEEERDTAGRGSLRLGRRVVAGSRITLSVRSSVAGRVFVSGGRVRGSSVVVSGGRVYRVSVRLTARARDVLVARGSVVARLRVSLRARDGARVVRSVSVRVGSK